MKKFWFWLGVFVFAMLIQFATGIAIDHYVSKSMFHPLRIVHIVVFICIYITCLGRMTDRRD